MLESTRESGTSGEAERDGCAGQACWHEPTRPTGELLETLRGQPFGAAGPTRDAKVARLRREVVDRPAIFVGTGTCGLGAGAARTREAIRSYLTEHALEADVVDVGCIGLCSQEPVVELQLPGRARVAFGPVPAERVAGLLDAALAGQVPDELLMGQHRPVAAQQAYPQVAFLDQHPFFRPQRRLVLANSGVVDPSDLDEYIARGGYLALHRALHALCPDEVCTEVERSGLRGRGGGGFPTARKWKLARQQTETERYLVCNADEGDPGAFMDRAVGESDPHRLLEGILLGAYAIGAHKAYVYIRAEYPLAVENLARAIERARAYGLVGERMLGTDVGIEVVIKMGAGAFVCGEETALIHSIEGRRGMPRPRPPYPVVQGLFGKPTVINNVETLANLPWIVEHGGDALAALGTEGSKGTKVFALSGQVARTGLVEVPMGTSLRDVVHAIGGGIPGGKRCKAVQIGGPSGGCIPEAHLDLATDYEALKSFGAIMGSGGLVVMDESTCMVDLAKFFLEFIQAESCGKCIPCREGTRRMLEILESLTRSHVHEHERDALVRYRGVMELESLGETIRATSLCGLGQTAPNPVLSTLRWFRDEYEAHLLERRCPAGSCKELVGAPCQGGCPVGTEVWRYVAHVSRGELDDAYRTIRRANPLPTTCARVCHHPCEAVCRAGTTGGDPVAVRALKRFVVDRVDPASFRPTGLPASKDAARVAVVGAGPAGLTVAHLLSLRGHRVSLFEKEAKPGGMLVCAIPEYRLPRASLEGEIGALLDENVTLRCDQALGRDFTLDGLFAEGFQAIYLALGAHRSKRLGIPGEDVPGVIPSIAFLKAHNLRGEALARGKVGVVGGGNSAIDAARVALRQPSVSHVTLFYRRTRDEMPAYGEEIEAALEEGVELCTLVAPLTVEAADGRLRAVVLQRNALGERDASGRRRPVPIACSEHRVELDTLIAAIGEEPDPSGIEALARSRHGTLQVQPDSQLTSRPGVFGGGDLVTGPRTLIEAVAAGKSAAVMIDRFLRGKQLKLLPRVELPSVYLEPADLGDDGDESTVQRARPRHLAAAERNTNFREVELCLGEREARCEARRCLRCDLEFTHGA